MTKLQYSNDEENLPIDDEQPWRNEFNALLDRMKTLEQQCQRQHEEDVPAPKNQTLSNTDANKVPETEDTNNIPRRRTLAHPAAPGTLLQDQESVAGLEQVDLIYDNFHLPASTFTFLITEPILSSPFAVGLVAYTVVSGIFSFTSHHKEHIPVSHGNCCVFEILCSVYCVSCSCVAE